ncbi:polysaccharide biosynthesis/export family protein [Microvirga subterranea]|nr:polysaccharide biosynthesis/export family protein [Microvirga subterranea]
MLQCIGRSDAADGASPQQLAPGDRVQVIVFQQPEISGDFIVDGAGAVTIPLIGAIAVQDLTLGEAEKRITQRLAEGFIDRPVVSLKINEQRPVYVLGDVRSPGSYPYRYGASVLSAVALAGGIGMQEQAVAGNRSEFLQADERLQVAQATHRALFIRRLRLEAQRLGSAKFDLPRDTTYSRDDPDVARIFKEEQDLLAVQRAGHEQTLRLLRDQKPRLEAEIAGVRAQAEAEQTQLELLQEHIADYNKLVTTGLARRYAMIELQREEARHKGNLARFAADIARLENSIGEIGVRMQEAENEYMRRAMTELQETRSRLQELDITIPVAQELRETRFQQSRAALMGMVDASYAVAILRTRSGKEEVVRAEMSTRLLPGDIVEVRRNGTPGSPSPTMSLISGVAMQANSGQDASKAEPLD